MSNDLIATCLRAYAAASALDCANRRTRWVMDLSHYKRLRADVEARDGQHTDPETWTLDPGDLLMGIPIDIRDDGGEPHLETPAAHEIGERR